MKLTTKRRRIFDRLHRLVRFFVYGIIGVYVLYLVVDHYETQEMEKQELRLSIHLLKLQLAKFK
jgi:hypothetical protein